MAQRTAPVAASGALAHRVLAARAPAPAGASPMVRPVQVNGAGPPLSVTAAVPVAPTRRYCWSAVSVPETDSVPGSTVPMVSPTVTAWSLRT